MNKKEKKETKNKSFIFRMTEEELKELEYLSYVTDKSKTELIREGLEMIKTLNKYR